MAPVSGRKINSTIEAAAARLRAISSAAGEGELLGSEDSLVAALGASRATMRQAARVLEREGVLTVRRGVNGGYFGARPDLATVEAAVGAYLDTLDMDTEDTTVVASVLWVEVVRKAAGLKGEAGPAVAEQFRGRVEILAPDAAFSQIVALEQACRTAIFNLVGARYIELIFQINAAFAGGRVTPPSEADHTEAHRDFVRAWRKAMLLQLDAIADGDPELAAMTARRVRNLWHRRIWPQAGV